MAVSIDLKGKNALVTGGTRGIGKSISLRLAEAGARVGMLYRQDEAAAEETLTRLRERDAGEPVAVRADIRDPEAAQQAVERVLAALGGSLDILVLNAASGPPGAIAEVEFDRWREPFDVNVHGHVTVCRAAYRALRPGGSVVFISSGAGHDPIAGLGAYGASKAAVNHLAAVLAQEWGPKGIRVNVVSPGHTAMQPVDYDHLSDRQRGIVETTALRRLGTPLDVANAVLLFCSDLAGFVTGQAVRVNGGRV